MLGNFALRASHGLVSILFFIPESGITDSLTLDIYLVIPKIDRHL